MTRLQKLSARRRLMHEKSSKVDLTSLLDEGLLYPTIRHGVRLGRGLAYPRHGRGRLAKTIQTRNAR